MPVIVSVNNDQAMLIQVLCTKIIECVVHLSTVFTNRENKDDMLIC